MDDDLVISDESLVRQYQRGNLIAFDKLYLKYRDLVYYQILAIVHHQEDAWDIHQETFWKVYQHLPTLCLKSTFKVWLSTIAKRKCIDYLRRKRCPQKYIQTPEILDTIVDQYNPPPDVQIIVDEALGEALQQMDPRHRSVLLLDMQNYSLEEIARKLGWKVGTVRTYLSAARRSLHQCLQVEAPRTKCPKRTTSHRFLKKPRHVNDYQRECL